MKSFLGFLAEQAESKYVAVVYDDASQKRLRDWATKSGFNLGLDFNQEKQDPKDFDFHTTVFYTTSLHDTPNQTFNAAIDDVEFVGFELLGPDKNIPVILIQSPSISKLRAKFEAMGFKDQWDSYKPHISLSYDRGADYSFVQNLELPKFKISAVSGEIKTGAV
jgi:2'-5' RNA ligase